MTTPRKSERRPAPTEIDVKNKGTKRRPVDAMSPRAQPTPTTDLPTESPSFVIGGIGAFAAEVEAIEDFFRHTPARSRMAFAVVAHQPTAWREGKKVGSEKQEALNAQHSKLKATQKH